LPTTQFECPYCYTPLVYKGELPAIVNCPTCGSQIELNHYGSTNLRKNGPQTPPVGPATGVGLIAGAIIGGLIGSPPGAIVGAIIGAIIGNRSEPKR